MAEAMRRAGVYKFAFATACCTVLLLVAGALVTSNDAADSVPDWPLAYNRIIPPWVGGIRYEFTHRVFAGLVAVLTAILAVWIARSETRRSIRRLGWTALALVLAQAGLGALRVLKGHPALTATAHAILAQVFFIAVVSLALFMSPWWQRELPSLKDSGSPSLRSVSLWTTSIIFLQLILGAGFRHGAFGIIPHMGGAAAVLFFAIWTSRTVRKRFKTVRELRKGAIYLNSAVGLQILLGGAAYGAIVAARTAVQPTFVYVVLTVAHVLVGALTLASSLLLTLSCFRMIGPSDAIETSSHAVNASTARAAGKASA
jgi:cytochrome c oxidase assembly protein subunit 15